MKKYEVNKNIIFYEDTDSLVFFNSNHQLIGEYIIKENKLKLNRELLNENDVKLIEDLVYNS